MTENIRVDIIDFFGNLNQKTVQSLISIVGGAEINKTSEIIIRLSSGGGDLSPTFAAYQFLREVSVPLTIYNFGNVESSAVILYLAGNTRRAARSSRFMLHPFFWGFAPGPVYIAGLREAIATLEIDAKRYADIFYERTQGADKSVDVLKCLEGHPLVIGAEEARSYGITTIDPIEFTIPTGAVRSLIVDT